MPPPVHAESYNPPKEYLWTKEEKKKWEEQEPEERELDFEPLVCVPLVFFYEVHAQKFDCLRHVPGYRKLITERYQRCLDLYLAPRQRKKKVCCGESELLGEVLLQLNVQSAADLLPPLPKPQDLQPFPQKLSLVSLCSDKSL